MAHQSHEGKTELLHGGSQNCPKKDALHSLPAFSQMQRDALGTQWHPKSILHFFPYKILQSCSTVLPNNESGPLGRRKKQWAPVLRLPTEKIGAHARTTGFRKCFISGNENAVVLLAPWPSGIRCLQPPPQNGIFSHFLAFISN
jgi:hypothetical protein